MSFAASFSNVLKQMPPEVIRALAIFVAINVLAFVVVTYALVRQTFWWMVVGTIIGGGIFSLWVGVGFSAYKGFSQAKARRQMMENSHRTEGTTARTLTGIKQPYKIGLPAGWRPYWSNHKIDLGMYDGTGLYVGVAADKPVGTAIDAANQARERVKAQGKNVQMSEMTQVQIDGHTWLRFTVRGQRAEPPAGEVHQQFNVYSGPEGSFEVLGWRRGGFHPQDESTISEMAAGFRFPVAQRTPPTPLNFRTVEPSPAFPGATVAP